MRKLLGIGGNSDGSSILERLHIVLLLGIIGLGIWPWAGGVFLFHGAATEEPANTLQGVFMNVFTATNFVVVFLVLLAVAVAVLVFKLISFLLVGSNENKSWLSMFEAVSPAVWTHLAALIILLNLSSCAGMFLTGTSN